MECAHVDRVTIEFYSLFMSIEFLLMAFVKPSFLLQSYSISVRIRILDSNFGFEF